MSVSLLPDEQIKTVSDRKKDGVELHCVEFKRGTWERTLCFDSRGELVSSDDHIFRFQYSDFQKFGEKLYPHNMQVYKNGERVLDMKVIELTPLPDTTPAHFEHDKSAQLTSLCETWERIAPVKKVQPQYPPEARMQRQQGTVTLYALIAADGSVQRLKLLESAGTALDDASMQAVKQWVYAPATCGTRPLPSEIEVQVNFSLTPPI